MTQVDRYTLVKQIPLAYHLEKCNSVYNNWTRRQFNVICMDGKRPF